MKFITEFPQVRFLMSSNPCTHLNTSMNTENADEHDTFSPKLDLSIVKSSDFISQESH
jgi:hypothetical protein